MSYRLAVLNPNPFVPHSGETSPLQLIDPENLGIRVVGHDDSTKISVLVRLTLAFTRE